MKTLNKSKYNHIYELLTQHGYDYDRIVHNTGSFRIHIFKWGKDHLITYKRPKEEYQEFYYMIKKYLYDCQ